MKDIQVQVELTLIAKLALTLNLMLKLMRVSETTNKICFLHVSIICDAIFGCFPWDTTCPEKQ